MNALITGATSGIGKEFVKLLASEGYNVILVARNVELLNECKKDIESAYKVSVSIYPFDLTLISSLKELTDKIIKEHDIDIFINNAGMGYHELLCKTDQSIITKMIDLNVTAMTLLTRYILDNMLITKKGKILIVSSTAAYSPDPYFCVYAASKSYDLSFAKSLNSELRDTDISVSVLCPGPTKSNFAKSAQKGEDKNASNPFDVAKTGYKGLMKNKLVIIPGFKNKISVFATKIIPHCLLGKIMYKYQTKLKK